jgi:myo-inositol-1(or 4)-monophosphatase
MAANEIDIRLITAAAVAREAGALARRSFRARTRAQRPEFKGPQDVVTATDAEAETLIRQRLRSTFPGDSFFGEEGGGAFLPYRSRSCAAASHRSASSTM